MDRLILLDAARQLEKVGTRPGTMFATAQGVRQFNAILEGAKAQLPARRDILALECFEDAGHVECDDYRDSVRRLRVALELRPLDGVAAFLADVSLPGSAGAAVARDATELLKAATSGLAKTTLLFSGLVAEELLLGRHPDASEYGPGLPELVRQAKRQGLFGTDTLRQLEILVDYRNLIHPRSQVRNRIEPDQGRAESALAALRSLWKELESKPDLRFR